MLIGLLILRLKHNLNCFHKSTQLMFWKTSLHLPYYMFTAKQIEESYLSSINT